MAAERLRVCELFAGIGGWRLAADFAVEPDGRELEVKAFDSGPHCSEVYALNFGEQCSRRNIEQLEVRDLEGFELWVMSPPCQPFSQTKEAKQRDMGDKRCKALGHLCKMLPLLQRPPRWVALENVKGFHDSEACERWRSVLAEAGYTGLEFLLDLASFGVPNHRTRYYLLAERSERLPSLLRPGQPSARAGCEEEDGEGEEADGAAAFEERALLPPGVLAAGSAWARRWRGAVEEAHARAKSAGCREGQEAAFRELRLRFREELLAERPEAAFALGERGEELLAWKLLPLPKGRRDAFLLSFDADREAGRRLALRLAAAGGETEWSWAESAAASAPRSLAEYLLPEGGEDAELLVPLEVLRKPFARGLSYVEPKDVQSFCFTGHYGKVLHKSSGSLLHRQAGGGRPLDRGEPAASHGSVRFFSPKEILNLLGFPADFRLPPEMELRHRYKVVGNSIAVTVAGRLLRLLMAGEDPLGLLGRRS